MNTIKIKSYVNVHDEKIGSGTISPGMLVRRTSADLVAVHNVAGGACNVLVAIEDENQGNDILDDYATTTLVKLWKPTPGDVANLLCVASGNAIVIGDFIESAGNGRVRKCDGPLSSAGKSEFPASIIGVALEAATPGVTAHFQVEIM